MYKIEIKNKDGNWIEIHGHCCYTPRDILEYTNMLMDLGSSEDDIRVTKL